MIYSGNFYTNEICGWHCLCLLEYYIQEDQNVKLKYLINLLCYTNLMLVRVLQESMWSKKWVVEVAIAIYST